MEEKILGLLEHQSYSLKSLQERLNVSEMELLCILEDLQKKQLIYINNHNKFSKVLNGHVIGRIDSDHKGHKFIRYKNEKIFIKRDYLHTAFKNDLVVVEIYENHFGVVLGIIERKNNRLVCEVTKKGNKLMLVPFNVGCEVTIAISDKELLKDLVEGDRVVVTLQDNIDDTNTILVSSLKRIGHKNDPKSDELAIAISKDFDIDFSKDATSESLEIPSEVREEDKLGRTDYTNDTVFTIDSIHTKDMDDAISIRKCYNGNYLLGVHIADVAHYIKPGMALFKDAEKRGTSLYLGDTVIPMIPHKLSNGICSLNEGVERLTKSCIMEIDEKGKVVNYKIVDSVIKSKKKMTYEELNALFKGEEVDESYLPFLYDLSLMRELSDILTKAKNRRGNIDFDSNDVKVQNDENERPIEFTERTNDEAERLIENFMIAANETVASYFYWQDLPSIYRVHNIPDEIKLERTIELIKKIGPKLIKLQNSYSQKALQSILNQFKGTPEYSIISNMLLRNMAKAVYSTENTGHFGLALDNYCHFTSPIRRFPDLMIHHLLNIFNKDYSLNNLEKIRERLTAISQHSSYKERQADDAERDYLKLKMAKFMESHIGEDFEGTLIDIDSGAVTIKLDNNVKGILAHTEDFCQAFYVDPVNKELKCRHSKTKAKLSSRVTIRVHSVNIPLKEVHFELLEIHKTRTLARVKTEEEDI